VKKVMVTIFSR